MRNLIDIVEGIDRTARLEFSHGGCGVLAAVLHDRTGWPIHGQPYRDHPDMLAHIWVVRPDGKAVDINGVHETSIARMEQNTGTDGLLDPEWAGEDEDMADLYGEVISLDPSQVGLDRPIRMYHWAKHLVDSNPDYFGLTDH